MAVLITGFCPAHGAGTVDFSFGETAVCTPRPGIYILLSAKPAQDPQLSFNGPVSLPPVISPRSFQLNPRQFGQPVRTVRAPLSYRLPVFTGKVKQTGVFIILPP